MNYHSTLTFLSLFATVGLALGFSSCDDRKDLEPGTLTEETAAVLNLVARDGSFSQVSPYTCRSFVLSDPDVVSQTVTMNVGVFNPAEKDLVVSLSVDKDAASKYATHQGLDYPLLDPSLIELPKDVIIKEGTVNSDNFDIAVRVPSTLEPNTKYLFAISLDQVEGAQVIKPLHNIALFTIERFVESTDILKSVRLTRDLYFEIAQEFGSKGDDALTMETLICVEKFRDETDQGEAKISTLMGIEGGTLMRFGDQGIPGNHLQAAGTEIDFDFKTGQWYHVAMTCDKGSTKVYVDGKLQATFDKDCSLQGDNPFLIGRSYSGGRGIQARLSEMRIWTVVRSEEEIRQGMYRVDASAPGLLAYWRMITADGSVVADMTGNGYDLHLKGQAEKEGDQPVEIYDESSPIVIR